MSELKIYKASAGSGKTYTLAQEYIKQLLLSPSEEAYRHILAVTFTKDATGEMKERILAELYGLAFGCQDSEGFMKDIREKLLEDKRPMSRILIQEKAKKVLHAILHDYSRLYITTIDSFFQKILRNLARELGKGSRFNLEMNSSKVLAEAVRSMIEKANENPQILEWLTTYIEDKLDEGGNWRIDREILNFSRCIFDEYFQEHEQVLKKQLENNPKIFTELKTQHVRIQKDCKAFFQKAWSEVNTQMIQYQLELDDFSRKGTVINYFKKLAEGDFVGAKRGSTIEDCCTDAEKWPASKSKRKNEIISLAALNFMPLLNQTLDILRKYNTSRMITRNIHQLGLIWDITREIGEQNAENNRFMLADTALFLNRMIDGSDAPFIYEKIGAEIRHVMIDEFQDTSRLQWSNFKALLSNILANNYFSLIVGDVKQSIYRWRNGDWRILNQVENELHASAKTLGFNYRSEKEVIDFNNHFFTHAAQLLNEKYFSLFESGNLSPFIATYDPADVVQQTKKTTNAGFVSIDFVPDKTEEAKYNDLVPERLFEQLRLLQESGIPAHEICILTRTNKSIIQLAEYLASRKSDYPGLAAAHYLSVVSNEAFQLNSSPAIRIIIEALRVIADPENPVHRAQLEFFVQAQQEIRQSGKFGDSEHSGKFQQSSPCPLQRGIGLRTQQEQEVAGVSYPPLEGAGGGLSLTPELSLRESDLGQMPLFELIGHLFRMLELDQISGQSGYLFAFYDAVGNYLNDNPADIPAFLVFWNDELQYKSVPSGTAVEGVRAMTIHKSKGLQFHTVLLPFCDWDLFPERNPIVWCTPKSGLYDLELLPVKYSQSMNNTVFSGEYEEETCQSWMDNLNILYVAFTRAEHNLMIWAKQKKKLESIDDIKTVSDLLQFSIPELEGRYDEENGRFEKGLLDTRIPEAAGSSDNPLKQTLPSLVAPFVSKPFQAGKSIFKQSNKSREFVHPEAPSKESYVAYGNVMHDLFSRIETTGDIDRSVDRLLFEGLILPEEKQIYINKIHRAISESGVDEWFSGRYKSYRECTVLLETDGELTSMRPDRVLLSDESTIIIDYKFGEVRPAHRKQIQEYVALLRQMNYPGIEAYLWYVEDCRVETVVS